MKTYSDLAAIGRDVRPDGTNALDLLTVTLRSGRRVALVLPCAMTPDECNEAADEIKRIGDVVQRIHGRI